MSIPHYLLFSESPQGKKRRVGQWRFVLETADGSTKFEASDCEVETPQDRLALLAVVRGLEAIDQPSRVTLLTPSEYVVRGLRRDSAPTNGPTSNDPREELRWPASNHDLWRRVARALQYHRIECKCWRDNWEDSPFSTNPPMTAPPTRRPSIAPPLTRGAVAIVRQIGKIFSRRSDPQQVASQHTNA